MRRFYDLGIGTKLLTAFAILCAITALVGVMGIKNMATMDKMAEEMYTKELLGLSYIKEANVDLVSIGRAQKNLLLATTDAQREKCRSEFEDYKQKLLDNVKMATPLIHTDRGKQLLTQFDDRWKEYVAVNDRVVELGLQDDLQKKRDSVTLAFGAGRDAANAIDSIMDELSKAKETLAKQAADNTSDIYNKSRTFMVILVLAALLFGIGLGIFISRLIAKPVQSLAASADQIALGDLTVSIDVEGKDEVGRLAQSFRNMVDNLREVIGSVSEASNQVSASSQELTATAQEVGKASQSIAETINQVAVGSQEQSKIVLSASTSMEQLSQAIDEVAKGAASQASTVEETVSLVQQISTAIDSVAKTAQSIASASLEVSEVAKTGGDSVGSAVEGMARIKNTTSEVAEAITKLGDNSQQIGAIVETINDIAEQTNLLALNAAIEAARAGDHGKGFAVVADEVRKLAERSSRATKEIADLIGNIQQMTQQAVEAMQAGTSEVETGTALANQAGDALSGIQQAVDGIVRQIEDLSSSSQQMSASSTEIVKAIENVSAITEESTAATEEMAASSNEVAKTVDQVAAVSEENAASAEEVSAAAEEQNASVEQITASSEELAKMAQSLQSLVARFRLDSSNSGSKVLLLNERASDLRGYRKAA